MRTALEWLYWLGYQALSLPCIVLGVPVVAVLAATRSWHRRASRLPAFFPGTVVSWRHEPWTLPWTNEENGVLGPATWMSGYDDRLRAFVWCAFRNTAYGLRLLPHANQRLPESVTTRTAGFLSLCTSGPYQCIHVGRWIRLGWRVWPDNQKGDIAWPVISIKKR